MEMNSSIVSLSISYMLDILYNVQFITSLFYCLYFIDSHSVRESWQLDNGILRILCITSGIFHDVYAKGV